MYPLFGLVGPSGSGKTWLILEMIKRFPDQLAILKSLTTRAPRDAQDALFYHFTTREDILQRQKGGHLLQIAEYAGNLYATDREEVYALLSKKCGISALVESSIKNFREGGCDVILIQIKPINHQTRMGREHADAERAKVRLLFDHEIINAFEPGGKAHAIKELSSILENHFSSSAATSRHTTRRQGDTSE